VTLRCGWEDWVDVVAQRTDPRIAIATGKLRPKGSPRALWRMRKLLAA
jgi:putative sterol carrier protein